MVRVLKSNSSAPKIPSIEIHEPPLEHNETIWRTKMHRIAIEFASTFIGQAIMMQFDKLLWTLEKTTTWISSGKTGKRRFTFFSFERKTNDYSKKRCKEENKAKKQQAKRKVKPQSNRMKNEHSLKCMQTVIGYNDTSYVRILTLPRNTWVQLLHTLTHPGDSLMILMHRTHTHTPCIIKSVCFTDKRMYRLCLTVCILKIENNLIEFRLPYSFDVHLVASFTP